MLSPSLMRPRKIKREILCCYYFCAALLPYTITLRLLLLLVLLSTFFCLFRPCLILLTRRAVQKGIRKCKQINSLAYYASLPPLSLASCSPLYLVFPLSLARWRSLLACFFPRRCGRLGHFCWDMLYDYVSKCLTYVFSIGPRGACGLIWVLSLNLKTVLSWTRIGCLSAKMHKMWMRSRAGLWAISKMNGWCFV